MKKLILKPVCYALCVLSLFASPVAFNGCGTTSGIPPLSQSATDQVILRAEQTAETAKLTFNTLLHLERDNEALLKQASPQIHVWTETVRRNGINWIVSLRNATKDFKANRTSANQATLNTALTTLTNALNETNKYIAQAKKVSQP
jgi:leucyl-tRNA synthetase